MVVQSESIDGHAAEKSAKAADYKPPGVRPSQRCRADYNWRCMDTLARIKELAAKEFSIDANGLDPAAPLDTLGIDSLSFIEFMFKVEEEFGISVSDEDLRGIKTLADLERHVGAALAAAGKA